MTTRPSQAALDRALALTTAFVGVDGLGQQVLIEDLRSLSVEDLVETCWASVTMTAHVIFVQVLRELNDADEETPEALVDAGALRVLQEVALLYAGEPEES